MQEDLMTTRAMLLAICCLCGVAPATAQDVPEPKISDYLADTGATYVGAAGIINLDDKLVTNVSSPKDFVISAGQGKNEVSKNGFGVAYAPGRSRFTTTAVNIAKYGKAEPGDWLSMAGYEHRWRRLLNSATISYAQNKRTVDSVDYTQKALAVHVEYFTKFDEDPTVAAYRLVTGQLDQVEQEAHGKACLALVKLRDAARDAARKAAAPAPMAAPAMVTRMAVLAPDPKPSEAEAGAAASALPNLPAEAKRAKVLAKNARAILSLARTEAAVAPAAAASAAETTKEADELEKLVQDCADEALKKSREKWNASKFTLLVGKGQIAGSDAGDARLSLGTHVQLGFQTALGSTTDSLLTFTARHTSKALNIDTLRTTPTYKSSSLLAARYTYGYNENRTLYYLAEISNASNKNGAVSDGAFKYAIGIDKKLEDSMWLELRVGKSVVRNGEASETKAMANVKFSFDSELAGLKK
jgi:hypothetical protein